jgi:hypothetical protein
MDALSSEKTWFLEAVLQHAFDPQKSCAVYSPLLISPQFAEARFVTPVSLSEIDNFLFANNTLYVDIRIADSPLASSGVPALVGSSVPSAHNILPFAGLQNAGWGSYVNGIIQMLFHIPAFRATVYDMPEGSSLVRELQRLFGGLEVPSRTSSSRLLLKAFGWNQADVLLHHDSSDFVRFLLGKLSESSGDSTIQDLFAIKFTPVTRTADFLAPRVESILTLAVDVHGSGSLDDALSKAFMPEIRGQLSPGRSDIPINSEIVDFPPVLIVHLRRFEFNRLTGKREKNNESFSFPEALDIGRYVPRSKMLYQYELFGVLTHSGNTPSGTYFGFIRPTPDHEWHQFNDSLVSLSSRDQAVFGNFGRVTPLNAYLLVYVRKNALANVYRRVEVPKRIRDFVSSVQLRAQTSSRRRMEQPVKTLKLITDQDIRNIVLEGGSVTDIDVVPTEIPVEDDWTNRELYTRVAASIGRTVNLLRLWKVDAANMPTVPVADNFQRFPSKETVLFVQELPEPQVFFERAMRIAFVSFFFPHATPKVQFLGAITVVNTQPITQLFPILWSVLGIPGTVFNVYCETFWPITPLSQNVPLIDLGIDESASFIVESLVPVQTHYQPGYCKPKPEEIISYYLKARPSGELNVGQYLERKFPQLKIDIFHVSNTADPRVTVSAPETLVVTELPDFILFATKEIFDSKHDTIQIFRRKFDSDSNEIMPYVLKADTTLKVLFSSEMRRNEDLRLFYDIVHGYQPDQLKTMTIRTCDIYESPLSCRQRIRHPMRASESLQQLIQYIQREFLPCSHGRLLVDDEGTVRPVAPSDVVEESSLLRFEAVPPDQIRLKSGEFLIVAALCRYSKGVNNSVPLGISFMFKVVPGEILRETRNRIAQYKFADEKLTPSILFQANRRILNDDERLDTFLKPNDVLKVVLPDKTRSNALIKDAKREPGKQAGNLFHNDSLPFL